MANRKKKKFRMSMYKKRKRKKVSFLRLKRYIFYHIQMEVKENGQEQSIMVGQSKNGALLTII